MTNSLKNVLKSLSSRLGHNLIASDGISHIDQIGKWLPNIPMVSDAGFECHLGSSAPRTDFLAAFTLLNQGRETLVSSSQNVVNLSSSSDSLVWKKVHDFSTHWANSNSSLYENVNNIWLEFDLDEKSLEVPKPSLFFGPKNIKGQKHKLSVYNQEKITSEYSWVAEEALSLLSSDPLTEAVKKQLSRCFELLPSDGEVFQIGVMLPRETESNAIRLCVEDISHEQILEYLKNIGWSDSSNELNLLLSQLSNLVDDIKLNFAIEDTIFPKIGLECYLYKQPKHSPKWKLFRNYLVENKLCTLAQANDIFNWTGCSEQKDNQKFWQNNFGETFALDYPNFRSTIVRLLHHIKIVYQPNQPLQAKAYLWFGHRWLSQNSSFQESVGAICCS